MLWSGLELFSTRLGDLYYESNEEDPYIIKNDDEVSMLSLAMIELCCLFRVFAIVSEDNEPCFLLY